MKAKRKSTQKKYTSKEVAEFKSLFEQSENLEIQFYKSQIRLKALRKKILATLFGS